MLILKIQISPPIYFGIKTALHPLIHANFEDSIFGRREGKWTCLYAGHFSTQKATWVPWFNQNYGTFKLQYQIKGHSGRKEYQKHERLQSFQKKLKIVKFANSSRTMYLKKRWKITFFPTRLYFNGFMERVLGKVFGVMRCPF
jgi:hypothetical protein